MINHLLTLAETTLLLSVATLYILSCPFNKVEESFNTQAVHDIINILPQKLPLHDLDNLPVGSETAVRSQLPWDHMIFPGVVPRTFLGALFVALPLKSLTYFMSIGLIVEAESEREADLSSQFFTQIGSRFALSSLVILSLTSVTRAIHRRYGLSFRLCFLLTTICQFHYLFYAGRFIPNTFAAILFNLVLASWINRHYSKSIIYIAFSVVVFRFDTSIFYGWLLIDAVFVRNILPLGKVLKVGLPSGLFAMLVSFVVDSIFWARPTLPEIEGLYFNLWLNKSHEWGTESFYWYIYNCMPRILMASSPLIFLADHKITRDHMFTTLAFIFTYSFLPHKELRFILFVTPSLNICVASGLMNIYYYLNKIFSYMGSNLGRKKVDRSESKERQPRDKTNRIAVLLFAFALLGITIANLFASFILTRVSMQNYPGGQAAISLGVTKELLDQAQKSVNRASGLIDPRSDVAVYVDNLAAQTGVSRFVQVNGVYYAKSPKLDSNTFTKSYKLIYLLLEPKETVDFLRSYCPENEQKDLMQLGVEKWKQSDREIRCRLPNQDMMYCFSTMNINSFRSINMGRLLRLLKEKLTSWPLETIFVEDSEYIQTRLALSIIRCSTRSKSNPFE